MIPPFNHAGGTGSRGVNYAPERGLFLVLKEGRAHEPQIGLSERRETCYDSFIDEHPKTRQRGAEELKREVRMKGGFLFIVAIVLGLLSVVLKNKQDDERAEMEARIEAYREKRRKEQAEAPKVIKEMADWIFSPSRVRKSVLEELDETYPTVELEEEPDNPKDPGAIAVMYNDADGNDVRLGYLFKGKLYDAVHEALDNGGKFYASINSVDWDRHENDPKKCIEISVNFTE